MSELHGKARLHRAHIIVSASGPAGGEVRHSMRGARRSRDGADLRYTTADCDWFAEHLSDTEESGDVGGVDRSYRLVNPSRSDFAAAISDAGTFLAEFIGHNGWAGGQMTFVYAGHGSEGSGAWVLRDASISGSEVADLVARAVPENRRRCRIDALVDSCYAGAFVADLISHSWNELPERIFPCEILGASLANEVAYELDDYEHGIFTFAYMAMSMPVVIGQPRLPRHGWDGIRDTDRLRSGGVSWLTDDEQHAFEYLNGHLEVIGAGHMLLSEHEGALTSEQIALGLSDALNVRWNERVPVPA